MRTATRLHPLVALVGFAALGAACAAERSVGSDGDRTADGSSTSGGGGGGSGAGGPDTPPSVAVHDAHPVLNDTNAAVLVTLSHPWSDDVSVDLSTVDGSAMGDPSGNGDYVPFSGTVVVPAGKLSAVVLIEVETPYKTLTLETALSTQFATHIENATGGATISDADGIVTLAQAGMVIETPLASALFDADIAPDFNGDGGADLALSGSGGLAAVLLTPATVFAEAGHVVADTPYLDGEQGFSYPVTTPTSAVLGGGVVAGDGSMAADFDQDGLSDLLVIGESKAQILYGQPTPVASFAPGAPELTDGNHASGLSAVIYTYGSGSLQTGDFNGDGIRDWGQANFYSSAAGGSDRFIGYYGMPGPYPGVYDAAPSFSFVSGTTAVGQNSLSNGVGSGVGADVNDDGIDDLIFCGISSNDGFFGGNYLYVKLGSKVELTEQNAAIRDTLDGTNGFQVANDDYQSNQSTFVPQDAGDLNGDGIADLVVTGGGKVITVIFGKTKPFASGVYANLDALGSEAAFFDTDTVVSARVGDLNKDGIGDLVFVTENKLRVLWGKQGLAGKPIFGTQYPEMGEIDIDPASGLDDVAVVGDLDGDDTADVVLLSNTWGGGTGGALVLFGKTLTRFLGGPDLDVPK
jgi:hypothetical protein